VKSVAQPTLCVVWGANGVRYANRHGRGIDDRDPRVHGLSNSTNNVRVVTPPRGPNTRDKILRSQGKVL
jgi:hypothetical protein